MEFLTDGFLRREVVGFKSQGWMKLPIVRGDQIPKICQE